MPQATENPPKKGCLSGIIKLILIVLLIVGGYYLYLYVADHYFAKDKTNSNVQTTDTTTSDSNSNSSSKSDFQKVGTVTPYKKATVIAESAGSLTKFNKEEGDLVNKNDLICIISNSHLIAIEQINHKNAQKNLDLAKESLISTISKVDNDTKNANIGVKTAALSYNNALKAYSNTAAYMDEQIKLAKLSVQASEIAWQAAQQNYYSYLDYSTTSDMALRDLEMAEERLAAAREMVTQTEVLKKSQLDLAQHSIDISKKQLESAKVQLSEVESQGELLIIDSKEQISQLEAQRDITIVNLKSTKIISPINGLILEKYVDEGDYINPSQRIAIIGDMTKVKVIVDLTEEELSQVKLGQNVTIKAPGGIKKEGKITKILPQVDTQSKKIGIEIVIPNSDGILKSGMSADVLFAG